MYTLAEADGETQTGFGFSIGRDPVNDPAIAAADAADEPLQLAGRRSRGERLTVVFDPRVTAQFLGIVDCTLTGEAVLKGRSMFADGSATPSPTR